MGATTPNGIGRIASVLTASSPNAPLTSREDYTYNAKEQLQSHALLEAPRDEMIAKLGQFLVSLAHAIDQRAPRLFDWRSMEPLVGYRSA